MASTCSDQKNQIVPRYEHSETISSRRKALFPVDNEDSNSDLGPMSPLSDSNSDTEIVRNCFLSNRMDDYVMLDDSVELDDENLDISTHSATMCDTPSSVNLNLTCTDSRSPFYYNRLKDKSPSKTLLTPHDTSTTNNQIPRLSRKSQSEDSGDENKLETKNPKARTALFTEVLPLSAKSFYPKTEECRPQRTFKIRGPEMQKTKSKSEDLYLCSRRKRNMLGQINAGVRHGIKKPKIKVKISPKNIAMSKTEGNHLVEYMKDIKDLTKNVPKQIKPLSRQAQKGKEKVNIKEHSYNITQILEDFDDEELPDINQIITDLDTSLDGNQITLTASKTVADSDNSIMLHHVANKNEEFTNNDRKRKHEEVVPTSIADMLLSPTSQMCDMTSEMAINSPKRAKLNINNILENKKHFQRRVNNVFNNVPSSSAMDNKKLFPIFYGKSNVDNKENLNTSKSVVPKKWNKIAPGQMLLDAGQKRFGFTQCPTCELVYHMGDPGDEEKHLKYHNGVHILKFKGWKNEKVVGTYGNDRIVKILPTDSKIWTKKVRDLMEIVNRELGFYESSVALENSATYLYIKNKNIVGCIVAEPKTSAFKMLSTIEDIDLCSEESYPIKCSVQRIWVAFGFRRHGIATALMDSLRKNFSHGYVLRLEDIAVSTPTDLGKKFAVKYFQTSNYLVCTM